MTEPPRQYLFTRWGTIVFSTETGELRHGDFRGVPRNVYLTADGMLQIAGKPPQSIEFVPTGQGILHGLRQNGLFFCAHPEGRFAASKTWLQEWENCLLMTDMLDQDILTILDNDWTLPDGEIVARAEITLGQDFILNFGSRKMNLADHADALIVDRAGAHVSAICFVAEGWQVCSARRFQPLIYFAVCGADHIFEMLRLSLESIFLFGNYDGKILILCDRDLDQLAAYIPKALQASVLTGRYRADDFQGKLMGRYTIAEQPVDVFQPVLYIDADIICNAALTPLLAACNEADSFYSSSEYGVTLEKMGEELSEWFGHFLFTSAGLKLSDFHGLNSGALAFSNTHFARPILESIITDFEKYRAEFPRESWKGDQPFVSFALQSQNLVKPTRLNQYLRFRRQNYSSAEQKTGLVHFNGGVGSNKIGEMSDYLEELKTEGRYKDFKLNLNRSIPGQMTDKELTRLAYLASQVPAGGIIVEVGCLYGLSSWHIAQHCKPGVTLFCIDPWERVTWIVEQIETPMNAPAFGRQAFEAFTADCNNIVMIQGLSPDVAKGWNLPLDMYVEDAVHTNPELGANISFWSGKVKRGGVICGHDYGTQWPEVSSEAEALAARYKASVDVVDTFWSVKKI